MESQASLDTYRTLRAGLVAAGLLLGTGLVLYVLSPGVGIPASISATFYSPLASVFVATLLSVGLALVAVKGRRGVENTLLDVAGAAIPVVAFVPTPIPSADCPPGGRDCIPPALLPAVDIGVRTYLVVGLVALVAAWARMTIAARTPTPWTLSSRRGLVPPTLLWAGAGGWYLFDRPGFLQFAHYTAAIGFFLLLLVVVWLNGRRTTGVNDLANLPASWYRGVYATIASAMLAALALGVLVFLVTGSQNAVLGDGRPVPIVFWIEVALLALFVTYWVFQTVELWNYTVPPNAS